MRWSAACQNTSVNLQTLKLFTNPHYLANCSNSLFNLLPALRATETGQTGNRTGNLRWWLQHVDPAEDAETGKLVVVAIMHAVGVTEANEA